MNMAPRVMGVILKHEWKGVHMEYTYFEISYLLFCISQWPLCEFIAI
jgi:hypothetical protein